MKKWLRFTFVMMLTLSIMLLAACGKEVEYPTQITNGGFELGTAEVWTGWTKTETAFSPRGIVSDLKVNDITVDKQVNSGSVVPMEVHKNGRNINIRPI